MINLDEIRPTLKPFIYRGQVRHGGGVAAWSFKKAARYQRLRDEYSAILERRDPDAEFENLVAQLAMLVPGWTAEDMGGEDDPDALNLPRLTALVNYLFTNEAPENPTPAGDEKATSAPAAT